MGETRRLARFISGLTYESLPEGVIEKTKELILDQLGCQLAGSTMPWSKAAYEYVADYKGPRQESSVVNYGLKTTAQDAAFANASFGNAFLADDTDSVCHGHFGAIIIPTALAMGEREGISGKEFIKAVVAGYEVASRTGAAAPSAESRGYHPGPIFGPFGVAACAGAILGFDEDGILNAIGIAGSHASGLMEYSNSGGNINRVHAGIAAYGGMRSVLLAQRGFSGPATILEGEKGFLHAFSGEYSPDEITRGLGEAYRVHLIDLKAHCCCGTSGACLDAVSKIVYEHDIRPKEIREIVVAVSAPTYRMTGTIVRPKDVTSAQFGGRFGVALRLIKGDNTFKEYSEENLSDPEILALEAKTEIVLDEALGKTPESDHPAKVTIRMADGTTFEETVLAAKGSILNPMTKDEVVEKFRGFASVVLPDHVIEAIIEKVEGLDTEDNIQELIQLLVTG